MAILSQTLLESLYLYDGDLSILNGLIAYWNFDENTGLTVADATRNGWTGAVSLSGLGFSWVTGIHNSGAHFDAGVGQSAVNIGTNAVFAPNQSTISSWYRGASPGSSFRGIFSKVGTTGLYLFSGNLATFDNLNSVARNSGVSVADGNWHHLVISSDDAVTNGTRMYIDGVLVMTTTAGRTTTVGAASIGQGQGGAAQKITGDVDEVAFWNRILSDDEVKSLYNHGLGWFYSFSPSGGLNKSLSMPLSEVITFTGSLLRQSMKVLADTITYTDTLLKRGSRTLTEVITYTGTLVKRTSRLLNETITYTDTLTRQASRILTETLSFTDVLAKRVSVLLTEVITYADTLIARTLTVYTMTFTEIIAFTDVFSKSSGKLLTEVISFTDTFLKSIVPGMKRVVLVSMYALRTALKHITAIRTTITGGEKDATINLNH